MWLNEAVAEIHELLQNLLYLQAEGQGAKPVKKDRPGFMYDLAAEETPAVDGEEVVEGLIPDEFFEED
ncbi:hypothetical protein OV450_3426 [Actinobacteria bacterium OV450]|nr:hypothetical protein OV450_3426 [Actinobacteria bacterium OV450]